MIDIWRDRRSMRWSYSSALAFWHTPTASTPAPRRIGTGTIPSRDPCPPSEMDSMCSLYSHHFDYLIICLVKVSDLIVDILKNERYSCKNTLKFYCPTLHYHRDIKGFKRTYCLPLISPSQLTFLFKSNAQLVTSTANDATINVIIWIQIFLPKNPF